MILAPEGPRRHHIRQLSDQEGVAGEEEWAALCRAMESACRRTWQDGRAREP
jgi:hypothetical protein